MGVADLENRFKYHKPATEQQSNDLQNTRDRCLELALFINEHTPTGREQALALTHLEEVMFWANAGIARKDYTEKVD